jgi:acyl-CoA thioesterase-1
MKRVLARPVAVCAPLLMAVAGACGSTASTAAPGEAPAAPALPQQVVVLGDSLAVSPSRAESFPAVLQARLSGLPTLWTIVNAGMGGDTTAGDLRRVNALLGPDAAVLIVALGANDGLRGVAIPTIEQNLSAIIERAQARQVRVLLCGMETPPLRNGRDGIHPNAAGARRIGDTIWPHLEPLVREGSPSSTHTFVRGLWAA